VSAAEDRPRCDVQAWSFTKDRLQRIAELETWHFWFVQRRVLVLRLLRKWLQGRRGVVLDVGCGTGLMLNALAREGCRAVGVEALGLHRSPGDGSATSPSLIRGDATRLPFGDSRFDAVLLLDVLEHVDDGLVLAEVRRALRPTGLLLLTVPAMPWLWSYRDVAAGHLRRYAYPQLRRVLTASGFLVCRIHYFNSVMLPLAIATRLLGRKTARMRDAEERPGALGNKLMGLVLRMEVALMDRLALPWGTSLVAVCHRRET
jgi:SAM-dependent methyltransferase